MRRALAPLLALAVLVPAPALATDGLAWQWEEGETRRYQIKADVKLAEVMRLKKENNSDIRVAEFLLGVTTSCRPTDTLGKRGWEVRCDLDDVQLVAAPVKSDAGKLQPILDEMDDNFTQAHAQLVFTGDGRLKNLDLEGLDKRNRRVNEIHETMRLLLSRAFAAFDMQLPKKGDDKDKGGWKQSASMMAMGFPSTFGTMGSADIQHEIAGVEDDVVEIQSVGRGTLGTGEMIAVRSGAPERPKNLFDMTIQGLATFDTASSTLTERQYLVEGTPTASSMAAEAGEGVGYVQAVRLVLIPEGEEAPALGENEEVEPTRDVF